MITVLARAIDDAGESIRSSKPPRMRTAPIEAGKASNGSACTCTSVSTSRKDGTLCWNWTRFCCATVCSSTTSAPLRPLCICEFVAGSLERVFGLGTAGTASSSASLSLKSSLSSVYCLHFSCVNSLIFSRIFFLFLASAGHRAAFESCFGPSYLPTKKASSAG